MIVRNINESAEDYTCRAVLEILEHLAGQMRVPTPRKPVRESTGITYTDEMAPYIELTAEKRKEVA